MAVLHWVTNSLRSRLLGCIILTVHYLTVTHSTVSSHLISLMKGLESTHVAHEDRGHTMPPVGGLQVFI
jgi:hypothetical protein